MKRRRVCRWCGWRLVILAISVGAFASSAFGSRDGVPVVLSGELLLWESVSPADVVAFANRDGWVQIPVQIDERDTREYAQVYGAYSNGNPNTADFGATVYGEMYCDPNTFTARLRSDSRCE